MTRLSYKWPHRPGRRGMLALGAGLAASGILSALPLASLARSAPASPTGAASATTITPLSSMAAAPSASGEAGLPTLLVIGDSISAEYGITRGSGWVSLLGEKLADHNPPFKVVNASISGETTAGGRSRIADLLARHSPAIVVIELGGNDALRGLDLDSTERNLMEMASRSRDAGAHVVVLGMQVPPNYGRRYTERFAGIFETVAQSSDAALVPFFYADIMDRPDAFLADRIHPSESAQPVLLETAWPAIASAIASSQRTSGS